MSIPGSWFGKRLPPLRAGSFTCSGPMEDSPDVGTEVTEVMLICPVIWPAAAMTNGPWKNRQPLINQISNVSNVNMTLRPGVPSQAPINAQMLAGRQREILNQHLRQRQMQRQQQQQVQQRTLMMRGQGLNVTPSMVAPSGIPAAMSNPRIPQANAQQFPLPPNYRISQQPEPGFTGATTPQSPLMSPRMVHTQSPMMQQSQANPAYQPPSDMNGWAQGSMGGNSMFSQQSPPHFGQQANTSMYNNNMNISVSMATNTGGLSNMNQMSVLAWLPLQEHPLLTA